jgi:hypothetical protein
MERRVSVEVLLHAAPSAGSLTRLERFILGGETQIAGLWKRTKELYPACIVLYSGTILELEGLELCNGKGASRRAVGNCRDSKAQ